MWPMCMGGYPGEEVARRRLLSSAVGRGARCCKTRQKYSRTARGRRARAPPACESARRAAPADGLAHNAAAWMPGSPACSPGWRCRSTASARCSSSPLVSATLLPLGSEPALFGLVMLNPTCSGRRSSWRRSATRSAARSAGRWATAPSAPTKASRTSSRPGRPAGARWRCVERCGTEACLLSWLPIVGDPLCAVAGWLRLPFWPCVGYMAIGKFAALPRLHHGAGVALAASAALARAARRPPCRCRDASPPKRGIPGKWGGGEHRGRGANGRCRPPPRRTSKGAQMTTTATPSYDALTGTWLRLYRLGHLQSMASWDQAANMPPKGNEARGQALAEIAMLTHGMRTDPPLEDHLARAKDEPLTTRSAPTCARSSATGSAPTRCRPSWSSAARSPPRAANTRGARSARPTTGPASPRT